MSDGGMILLVAKFSEDTITASKPGEIWLPPDESRLERHVVS